MSKMSKHWVAAGTMALAATSFGQVPDVLSALDAGGRAMGMGGAGNTTGADTLSGYYNPAGLGYIDTTQVGLAFRNMPESNSAVTGPFAPISQQQFSTTGSAGALGLSHAGIAMPLKTKGGASNGTISLGLTLGGFIHDTRTSQTLTSGAFTVRNYSELFKSRTDYVTLSYGRTNAAQNFNWGVGLVYATNGILNVRRGVLIDGGNNNVGNVDLDLEDTGTGFGVQAGITYVPPSSPNTLFAASYRSEINLSGNSQTQDMYDKIPARLAAGFATRREGLRGGRDYLVFGAEVEHLFSGGPSPFGGMRSAQTNLGAGIEYSYMAGWGRVPIRIGYGWVPSAGTHFGDRNGLTYGVGYRPSGSNFAVDFNWGTPSNGGTDFSVLVSYKVKK